MSLMIVGLQMLDEIVKYTLVICDFLVYIDDVRYNSRKT